MWVQVILGEVEKYSGDTLLQYQEQYSQCVNEVQTWNEIAHRVFSRHQQEDGTKFPEHEKMHQVNEVRPCHHSSYKSWSRLVKRFT